MYKRIQILRKLYHLTEEDLASYLGISTTCYLSYENGKQTIPVSILSKLAKKYHTSIDYLIGLTDVITPHPKN